MALWHHSTERPLPSRAEAVGVFVLFLIIGLAVYGASLTNSFVTLDDGLLIYENAVIRSPFSWDTIRRIFTMYDPELYIPVTFLSYKLETALFGQISTYFHITNLLLHAGSALLLYTIFFQLTGRRAVALPVALLFLLHPVNVEAVAWASGRKDTLSAFFALLSITLYLRYRAVVSRRSYYGSVIAFALALMSKVSVILLPLALLLIDWRESRTWKLHVFLEKVPYFALSAAFGVIALLGKSYAVVSTTLGEKILMAGKSTVFYLHSFIAPVNLTALYPYTKDITLASPDFYVPFIILSVLAALVLASLRRTREALFGSAFFIIFLVPSFINFAKGGSIYMASDRYVYLSYVGLFAIVVGAAVAYLDRVEGSAAARKSMRNSAVSAFAVVLAVFAVLTFRQSLTWRTSEALYTQALRFYPDSFQAHNNLGSYYFNYLNDFDRAREHFDKALEIKGDDPSILNNLAIMAREEGKIDEAVALHLRAADAATTAPGIVVEPYYSLGNLYVSINNIDEGIRWYTKAIELNADHTPSLINLGATYAQIGEREKAIEMYRRAIAVEPEAPYPYYNLAIQLELSKEIGEAEAMYKKAIELDSGYVDAYNNLGALYFDSGRLADSLAQFEKAAAVDPDNQMATTNLRMIRSMMQNQGSQEP